MSIILDPGSRSWGGGLGGTGRLFLKNEVYEQTICIKLVRNLSHNAGNGHFRDSNFQKFLGEHNPSLHGIPSILHLYVARLHL